MKLAVKINRCSVPGIWYENKIGRVFEVEEVRGMSGFRGYSVVGNPLFFIRYSDADLNVRPKQWHTRHIELITVYSNKNHYT